MKALLVVVVLLAVAIVGLGFYRGWFAFSSNKTDDKTNVTLTVDKDKFQEDKEKATEKVQGLGQDAKENTDDKKADKSKAVRSDKDKDDERRP